MSKSILIVSDLHIGEGLKVFADGTVVKPSRTFGDLISFVEHYNNKVGNWTLVINGDMIDFMSVVVESSGSILPLHEDNIYGLGTDVKKSKIKLQSVIDNYVPLFTAFAKFAINNKIEIVVGNHDLEFAYKPVQELFISLMSQLAGQTITNVTFHEWFYYEPDVLYAEHGHQFDEYCSIDYSFAPLNDEIVPSVAHLGMRYFANKVPNYDPRVAEKWGFLEHAKWSYDVGVRKTLMSLYHYSILVMKTLLTWYKLKRADKDRKETNDRMIACYSKQTGIKEDKLQRLYNLRRKPVSNNLFKIIGTYFIDRMALGTIGLAAVVWFSAYFHHHWKIVGPVIAIVVVGALNILFNKIRFGAASDKILRGTAKVIRMLMPAKYITFGHVHEAEIGLIDEHTTYINTGSWTEKNKLTYALLTDEGYSLRYWHMVE